MKSFLFDELANFLGLVSFSAEAKRSRAKAEADRKYYRIKTFFYCAHRNKEQKNFDFIISQHEEKTQTIFINEKCTAARTSPFRSVRENRMRKRENLRFARSGFVSGVLKSSKTFPRERMT